MSVQIQSNGKNKGIYQGIIVQHKLLTESGELKSPLLQGMIIQGESRVALRLGHFLKLVRPPLYHLHRYLHVVTMDIYLHISGYSAWDTLCACVIPSNHYDTYSFLSCLLGEIAASACLTSCSMLKRKSPLSKLNVAVIRQIHIYTNAVNFLSWEQPILRLMDHR